MGVCISDGTVCVCLYESCHAEAGLKIFVLVTHVEGLSINCLTKECWALSINICPRSFPITSGVTASPHPYLILQWVSFINSVQQSMKCALFTDLDFILEYTEIISSQYW